MATPNEGRIRLTIDISRKLKRRLRLVAAKQDITMREYLLQVLEEHLAQDLPAGEEEELLALSSESDPVLAELWDNDRDAAYDDL